MLQDGKTYYGRAIGLNGISTGEICFNTGMTGYQEIFTDPSYAGQIVTMTNVHIGNYGTSKLENQSSSVKIAGLIVRNFSEYYSRAQADQSLQEYLEENKVVGISDIDTRAVVRYIRSHGAMNVVIAPADTDPELLRSILASTADMSGCELASKVSLKEPIFRGDPDSELKVAVIDYGCKESIYQNLERRGLYLKIFPATVDFEVLDAWNPDAFFLSNGPGDPAAMDYAIDTVKSILSTGKPIFGICLGHQLLALASGMETEKLRYGHRGINHPVLNLETGLGEITSQNHGFGLKASSVELFKDEVAVTHINLNDQSIEGMRWLHKPVFSVQYHPEASPGPHDSRYLFDQFVEDIKQAEVTKNREINVSEN